MYSQVLWLAFACVFPNTVTWFSPNAFDMHPYLCNRNYCYQLKNLKTEHTLSFQKRRVKWEVWLIYCCLGYGGHSYAQPALLSFCLLIFLSSLSLTYISQAECARLPVPLSIEYLGRDAHISQGCSRCRLGPLSLDEGETVLWKKKCLTAKLHFSCLVIIPFSFSL